MTARFLGSILAVTCALAACRDERKAPAAAATTTAAASTAAAGGGAGSAGRPRPAGLAPTPVKPGSGAAVRLPILPSRVELVGSRTMQEFQLGADGAVRVGEREVGRLSADGRLTRDGTLVAELAEDGTLQVPGTDVPADRQIRIDPDGTVLVGDDVVWTIDEDGKIKTRGKDGVLEDGGLAVFDGPSDSRRAIAMLMALQMLSSRPREVPPAARRETP